MNDLIYYTPEQVAEILSLPSANYIRENHRRFPHIRIAKQLRFTPAHVEAIASMHQQDAEVATTGGNAFGRRKRGGAA